MSELEQKEEKESPDLSGEMADFKDFATEVESDAELDDEIVEDSGTDSVGGFEDEFDIGDTLEIDGEEVSVGDIYCNLVTVIANEVTKAHGSGDSLFSDESGELDTTLAKQLQLDDYVNQIAAKHSMGNMSPEQALILTTLIFFASVVIADPELMKGISSKIGERRQKP